MKQSSRKFFHRFAQASMLVAVLMTFSLGLLTPLSVKAVGESPEEALVVIPGAGMPVAITGNVYEEVKKKFSGFFSTLTLGGITALMNAFQVFSQRIAYDAAQRILTGDSGQYPLFWEDNFGSYLGKVAEDAGNQFISSINSDVFNSFGFDLCAPIDPLKLQLSLGTSQPGIPNGLKAKCTFAQIGAAFDKTKEAFNSSKEVFQNIAPQFDPHASELNVGIGFNNQFLDAQLKSLQSAALDRQETGGLKQVQDVISGNIKTPTQAIKDTLTETNFVKQQMKSGELNYLNLAGNAFQVGFTQLGVLTVSTFVSTLANGLLSKLFDGLTGGKLDVAQVDLAESQGAANRNVAKARILFSDLLTPNLISSDQQDFVVELSTCPQPRDLWGCAMDDAFAAALRTTGETGAYTVGRAAQVVLNGQPPNNPTFLHKDWELIPDSDVKENSDPSCYQRAYCASNLAKLRYARVIPVGWELAANSPHNKKRNGKYITLEEVIRGFNVCGSNGLADATHPWCKLIDPNWVLTAPPFQCRVKGYGDSVLTGTAVRLQECADAVSCLGRDDRGKCVAGYGYCLAEKPTWRFTADTCLERFASCRTYRTRTNEQVSFLRNTVDYGSCSADNVGCMWYATDRNPSVTSYDGWIGSLAATSGQRIYLDSSVKTCGAGDDGCTKLLEVKPNQPALNLIANGSFESPDPADDAKLWHWSLTTPYQIPSVADGAVSINGSRSLLRTPAVGIATSDALTVAAVRNYTFSVYVRAADVGAAELQAKLSLFKSNGQPVAAANVYRSPGCTINQNAVVGVSATINAQSGGVWQRYECTFVSNPDVAQATVSLQGSNILIDAVQLEETEKATDFVDGLSSSLNEVHLRIPPESLACTGQASDNPACAKYARICRQSEQGCQGYRDAQNPTSPEIPASLSALDACPASCVGYAEYRKQPSAFDLGKSTDERLNDPLDDTSASFVPAYAQQCSLADVGCEAFTDVGTTSTGAEKTAYYNYVRACEKPSADSETFFTWEGSDTTGYQLKTWSLIRDTNQIPAPPKVLLKAGPDGFLKNPSSCTAVSWKAGTDSDCRQFFDGEGNAFYAYFSQTILSTPDCRDLRKNNSNAADCGKTGGTFTAASGECVYHSLPSENRSCNQVNAGCRAYIGTSGRNTSLVFNEEFRGGTTTASFTAGSLSNESILVGDQSLKIAAPATQTATVFPSISNGLYSISFWAKTTSPQQVNANVFVDGENIGTMKMEVDWRRYEFGPFAVSSTSQTSVVTWANLPNATFIDQIRIERLQDVSYIVKNSWSIPQECDQTPEGLPQPQAMLGCRAYNDRAGVGVTVRRFGQLCREEAIGCKAFVDTRNSSDPYAQSFVMKGSYVNPKVDPAGKPIEPAFSYEQKYLGDATTTRSADRYLYAIDDQKFRCTADKDSCRAFGKPKFQQDQLALSSPSTTAFETVYLIDDINSYVDSSGEPGTLCRKNELFCEEFKSGKTTAYFRTPQDHTCEWRDKVLLKANPDGGIPVDGEYSGWFRTGNNQPCYPKQLSTGNTYLIQNSGDVGYAGWVGSCPLEQSECTEFRDPNDTRDPLHPSGKPYFFIKNSRLDLKSCDGKIDLLSGCVLFRDLSDARNRYSTVATYAKAKAEDNTPQAPIDCVSDPNNEYCQNAGVCANVEVDKRCQYQNSGTPNDPTDDTYNCPFLGATFNASLADDFVKAHATAACTSDVQCQDAPHAVNGHCNVNNANIVLKVKLDRDCAQWLGCSSSETVFDPAQQKYVDLCTNVSMCDASKGATAGSFCAHYVDRSKEPVLKKGVFFDRSVYTKRTVGFGELDYSGYSIPDRFQAADVQNRRVGLELFSNIKNLANTFALDYRLVAAVPESTGLVEFGVVDNLYPNLRLCRHKQTGRIGYYYLPVNGPNRVCYFSVDALSTRSLDVENQAVNQKVDPRNIQALADVLRQSADAKNDTTLQQSLPPAECKASPESDAPFPQYYAGDWDFKRVPFQPKNIAAGYSGIHLCEYGEDCACSYRKVSYGSQITKYVSPFGKAPIAGVCSGGSKDGESCVPGQEVKGTVPGDVVNTPTNEDPGCPGGGRCMAISNVVLVRGQFGQCLQRDYSRTLAGDPGRHPCLIWNPNPILSGTYDTAHYVPTAGYLPPVNAGEFYCLSYAHPPLESIWSAESHTDWNDSTKREGGDGGNQFFHLPGKLSKFNYDRGYVAGKCPSTADMCDGFNEGSCNCWDGSTRSGNGDYPGTNRDLAEVERQNKPALEAWAKKDFIPTPDMIATLVFNALNNWTAFIDFTRWQDLGQGLDGRSPSGSNNWQAEACAAVSAWKAQDQVQSGETPAPGIGPKEQSPDVDLNAGRWIMTGNGLGHTYAEYFVAIKPDGVYKWIHPSASADELKDASLLGDATLEKNFAEFKFFPVSDPYAAACRIPKWYVDGVDLNNPGDPTEVFAASKQIFSDFSRNFNGNLNRSKEDLIKNAEGKPIKERCSGLNDGKDPDYGDEAGRCYLKSWEINYRMDGTPKFEWLQAENGTSFYERKDKAYYHERTCSKSGFAIRAVFEDTQKFQNLIPEGEATKEQLGGPYRFVGFWITACTVGTDSESSLFLNLRVKHADICRDLAQTVSPYSRESAAFADRVWSQGSFTVPQLGFSYANSFTPFGSALANGIPGLEPLFQTGGPVENYSILNPPTFLGSGEEWVTSRPSPVHRWQHLLNVFARIYRIYKYYDTGITRDGYACFRGDPGSQLYTGVACPKPISGNDPDTAAEYDKQIGALCGGFGVCKTTALSTVEKNAVRRCNGLSGVNAGLDCGSSNELPSLDPVCHNAAMKHMPGGGYEPQLTACKLRGSWASEPPCEAAGQFRNPNNNVCYNAKTAHELYNAFGCEADAVVAGAGCSGPEKKSKDCPKLITNIPCIKDDFGAMAGHCGAGYEHARCSDAVGQVDGQGVPVASKDCVFTKAQWWGAYDTGKPALLEDIPAPAKLAIASAEQTNGDSSWETAGSPHLWAYYYPANGNARSALPLPFEVSGQGPTTGDMSQIARAAFQAGTTDGTFRFAGFSRAGGWAILDNTSALLKRYPQAYPVSDEGAGIGKRYYIPGLCEGAVNSLQDPNNAVPGISFGPQGVPNPAVMNLFFYSSDYLTGAGNASSVYALVAGECEGGVSDGQPCFNVSAGQAAGSWPHPNTCALPLDQQKAYACNKVATVNADGSQTPVSGCDADSGDAFSKNPDTDNNACTRSAGYKTLPEICGQNPDNEKCLTGYNLGAGDTQKSLDQLQTPSPTDVTAGFHTPSFLGLNDANPYDYEHIAHYAPRPPTVAAPDLSRNCQSPGSCGIAALGAVNIEGQSGGPIAFAGGQAQVNMRFYGWADHDQTPLKAVDVDWGDGTLVNIDNARMKNKKPFCGVTTECDLIPGLTCKSDSDCPPAGGKCAPRGTCSQTPSLNCSRDSECQVTGKAGDRCNIRQFFGNSEDACEANYFEFTHAYACDPKTLPSCNQNPNSNGNNADFRCLRQPAVVCTALSQSSAECGWDPCVAGLAPPASANNPGGCFDEAKAACIFTPRVMLKDSFNWCTGECRTGQKIGNQQVDGASSKVKHTYGGCWDGTETVKNSKVGEYIMSDSTDECTLKASDTQKFIRPWIVYPGAIEVGKAQ